MALGTRALVTAVALLAAACDGSTRTDTMASSVTERPSVLTTADSGTLRVGTSLPEAEIIIDGTLIGKGRLSVTLPAGSYRLNVRAPGFVPVERQVTVHAKDVTTETVTLTKA